MRIIIRIILALGMILTILFSGAFGRNPQYMAFAGSCEMLLFILYPLFNLLYRITWKELFFHLLILLACVLIPTNTLPHDLLDESPRELAWMDTIFICLFLFAIWVLGLIAQCIYALCHRKKTEVHGFEVILKNPKDNP